MFQSFDSSHSGAPHFIEQIHARVYSLLAWKIFNQSLCWTAMSEINELLYSSWKYFLNIYDVNSIQYSMIRIMLPTVIGEYGGLIWSNVCYQDISWSSNGKPPVHIFTPYIHVVSYTLICLKFHCNKNELHNVLLIFKNLWHKRNET